MRALVVYESCFGCTAQVAEAIADGLRSRDVSVSVVEAVDSPTLDGVDLLVVGAPTHNLGLPGPKSRELAEARGGAAARPAGVAEWLDGLAKLTVRAAAFDTVVPSRFSGSAARKIERRLSRLGATIVDRAEFTVVAEPPVPGPNQVRAAQAWGARLATAV